MGTLDTKGLEYSYLRNRLLADDLEVLVLDVGVNEPSGITPDITRHDLAAAIGADADALAHAGDRGNAVAVMTQAAATLVPRLYEEGRFDGVLAAGGSGGTAIATSAMQRLPVGVPKLMLSTMASGDTSPYVGATDITMMASVTDIAGVNSVSALILANAAAAIAGMVKKASVELRDPRPLVGECLRLTSHEVSLFAIWEADCLLARRPGPPRDFPSKHCRRRYPWWGPEALHTSWWVHQKKLSAAGI
jgi:uncharacterized protein (UPF0261 family)